MNALPENQSLEQRTITQIDVKQALATHYRPFNRWPTILQRFVAGALRLLIRESTINRFLAEHDHLDGLDFIEQVFEYLDFSYHIRHRDIRHIPPKGPLIVVANHPLGGLDGLSLLHLIGSVRRDVKIVASQVLKQIHPLSDLFLPVDNLSGDTRKQDIRQIEQALRDGQAVIFFPAGEVSRATLRGIKDNSWNAGFLRFSERFQVPVLPIYIRARNSAMFYFLSRFSMTLSMLCLPREMVGFSGRMRFYIGAKIESAQFQKMSLARLRKVKLAQRHVYNLSKKKPPIIVTQESIIHPQKRQTLKAELSVSEHLGTTADGKSILLVTSENGPAVLEEIGRLREEAFRAVGEGTGARRDIDRYDRYYRHIVVWDEDLLEIAGAYRLGEIWNWPKKDKARLYSSSLFSYDAAAQDMFDTGLELGRSFVQPQFWGKRSLDYLWQGIGAYVARHEKVRYLFGPVSLSGALPDMAKALLVRFYSIHYPDPEHLVASLLPFQADPQHSQFAARTLSGQDMTADFNILREQLDHLGVQIPTLYKQYSNVCEPGGVRFCAFNIDPDFNYCIDGLVVVDLQKLTQKKRQRYLEPYLKS